MKSNIEELKRKIDNSSIPFENDDLLDKIKRDLAIAKEKFLNLARSEDPELAEYIQKEFIPFLETDINTLVPASLTPEAYRIIVVGGYQIFMQKYIDIVMSRYGKFYGEPTQYMSHSLSKAVTLYLLLLYLPYVNGQYRKFILDVLERKKPMVVQ